LEENTSLRPPATETQKGAARSPGSLMSSPRRTATLLARSRTPSRAKRTSTAACSTATERNERHTSSGAPEVPLVAPGAAIRLLPRTNAPGATRTLSFSRTGQSPIDVAEPVLRPYSVRLASARTARRRSSVHARRSSSDARSKRSKSCVAARYQTGLRRTSASPARSVLTRATMPPTATRYAPALRRREADRRASEVHAAAVESYRGMGQWGVLRITSPSARGSPLRSGDYPAADV